MLFLPSAVLRSAFHLNFKPRIAKRVIRSDIGLWELEEYKGVKATVKELELQNSYFVQDLMNKHKIDKE